MFETQYLREKLVISLLKKDHHLVASVLLMKLEVKKLRPPVVKPISNPFPAGLKYVLKVCFPHLKLRVIGVIAFPLLLALLPFFILAREQGKTTGPMYNIKQESTNSPKNDKQMPDLRPLETIHPRFKGSVF